MGAAASVRELVKERPIYRRERAIGLSIGAYLTSKILVLGIITGLQATLFTTIALLVLQSHLGKVSTGPVVALTGPVLVAAAPF